MRRNIIIIAALIALYTVAWLSLAQRVEQRLLAQLDAGDANGMHLTVGARHKSGYPFAIKISFADFALTLKQGQTITAPRLDAGISLFDQSRIKLTADQGLTVTIPAGEKRAVVKAVFGEVSGTLGVADGQLQGIAVSLADAALTGLIEGDKPITADMISFSATRAAQPPKDFNDEGGRTIINATGIFLPGEAVPALGNHVTRLTLDASAMGVLPSLNEDSLAAWRDAGGTIEVHELSTEWGPMNMGMGGTLSLSPDMQPEGALTAKVSGFEEALQALSDSGVIKPKNLTLLSMGLGFLARPEGPRDTPTLTVPLSI